MVSVSGINSNFKTIGAGTKATGNLAFKGSYASRRILSKQILDSSPSGVKFLMNLGKNNGEILNTIVTGIGTAFVAPLFIAFNPLSKEDSETKVYSAWRQPLSAVLQVATLLFVNTKFNHWMDKLASTGQLDRANLTAKPAESYLKSLIKLEHPEYNKQQIALEMESKQDTAFWKKVSEMRTKFKNKKIPYSELIDKDALDVAKDQVKKEFKDQIKGMNKKEAEKFIAMKANRRAITNVKSLLVEEAKVKFDVRRIAAKHKGKSIEQIVNIYAKKLAQQQKHGASKRTLTHLQSVIDKLQAVKDLKNIKNLGKNFNEILQSVKIKKLVSSGINNSVDVLKSTKKWYGIVLSLAILPLSCGLLNWSYPRFMEIIMPNAHKKKHCPPSQPQQIAEQRKEVK